MDNRARIQNSATTTTGFSRLDWPTPDTLQAAKRARGEALRGMILALVEWAKAGTANQPSQAAIDTVAVRVTPKR
jgi:hypothetical protein